MNYALQVIMVGQCQFINCNKCNHSGREMLIWERLCIPESHGVLGNSLYFPLYFAVNLAKDKSFGGKKKRQICEKNIKVSSFLQVVTVLVESALST